MNKNNLETLVLNKIREINSGRPANAAEIFTSLGITHEELLPVLNSLYESGKISCGHEVKNIEINKDLKFKSFGIITAN